MFYGYMWGMHALWWVFWLVVVVALLYWVRDGGRERSGGTRESPHEVLRRRLAQGEIGAEEYEQRKALLDRDT